MTIKLVSKAPFEVDFEFSEDGHLVHRSAEYVLVTLSEDGRTSMDKVASVRQLFPNKDVKNTFRYILSRKDDMSLTIFYLQPTDDADVFQTTWAPKELGGMWTVWINSLGNVAVKRTKTNSSTPTIQVKEFPGDIDFLIKVSIILRCVSNRYYDNEQSVKNGYAEIFQKFKPRSA